MAKTPKPNLAERLHEQRPADIKERAQRAHQRLDEAGRVLSAVNEGKIRTALDNLQAVLDTLGDGSDAATEAKRQVVEAYSASAWDASSGAWLLSTLIELMGEEADEPDQFAMLQQAFNGISQWIAAEVGEINTADDETVPELVYDYEAVRQHIATAKTSAMREASLVGDIVPLREGAIRSDGTARLKVIQPGWGSSGYYSAEVLERDGPKIFTAGTKNFWDHPTQTEEVDRPERSLRDLAGELVSDVVYEEDGVEGPGLYADARVISEFAPAVNELAPFIGVSIRALGSAHHGTVEGRSGPIIDKLIAAESIDYVTTPGAGGRVIQLFEAARQRQPISSKEDDPEVDIAEAKRLQEDNERLRKENARQGEVLFLAEARTSVAAELAKFESIPEVTRKRLEESLTRTAAPTSEGKVDTVKIAEVVEAAVKAEAAYLAEVSGSGRIVGFGSTNPPVDNAIAEKELQELFTAGFGLSESEAKRAAKGRS